MSEKRKVTLQIQTLRMNCHCRQKIRSLVQLKHYSLMDIYKRMDLPLEIPDFNSFEVQHNPCITL